jgi:hypothetical protein
LNAPCEFRAAAQDFIEFFDFLVKRCRALEVQMLTGLLAFFLDRRAHRSAARFKELH